MCLTSTIYKLYCNFKHVLNYHHLNNLFIFDSVKQFFLYILVIRHYKPIKHRPLKGYILLGFLLGNV